MKLQFKIAFIAVMGITLGVKAQNFTTPINVSSSSDAIATFQTLDDSWLYTQWKNKSGQRKAYMGFNPTLTNFVLGLENGANQFSFPTGNFGIGTYNPKSKLHISGGSNNWNEAIQGLATGSIHLAPNNTTNNFGNAITFGASDSGNGETAQAGIYVRSDGYYGTKMYFATTNKYLTGSQTAMTIDNNGSIGIGTYNPKSKLQISGGSSNWNETTQGLATGSIHLAPNNTANNFGNAITFGASDSGNGETAQAGIYVRSDGYYGTKMYFATTDKYVTGSQTAMTIDNKGSIGIGTSAPTAKLDLRTVERTAFRIYKGNTTDKYLSMWHGTAGAVIEPIKTDGSVSLLYLGGYDNPTNVFLSNKEGGTVGIGTTNTKGFKLGVNGRIAATEVKIATYDNWADFVFYDDYKLPTLTEVENHIKEKGHLKDIPSAKEVAQNGIYLGQMDAKLLQKIEELTLYTIQQEKKIKTLEAEKTKTEKLEKEIETLKKLVSQLLKDKK